MKINPKNQAIFSSMQGKKLVANLQGLQYPHQRFKPSL
jgi:hypothetical protein